MELRQRGESRLERERKSMNAAQLCGVDNEAVLRVSHFPSGFPPEPLSG